MRLICPKCGAQYQVPDEAIPRTGRDVQCSNCGETWYALGEDTEEEVAAPPELPEEDEPEPERPEPDELDELADDEAEFDEADADEAYDDPDFDGEYDESRGEETVGGGRAGDALDRRRELSPDIAQILREEAEREAAARRAAAAETFEDQADLGLEPPPVAPSPRGVPGSRPEWRETEAPRHAPDRVEATPAPQPGAATAGPEAAETTEAEWRRGFRLGFAVVVLLALVFALVYAMAPRIAEAVPALGPALDTYVSQVESARLWLDLRLQDLLELVAG